MFLHFIFAKPHINLHFTEWVSESKTDSMLPHDCLRIAAPTNDFRASREMISYCINELSTNYHVEPHTVSPNFTFGELSQKKITSQQLYMWSAPIDIVERYQFYLNQLSTSSSKSLDDQVYYNCTLPRFGSKCQYEIIYYHQDYISLDDIIEQYYHAYAYNPTNFTCFTHLQCDRGPFPICLDWSEVCNGHIDCYDGEFDEEHCWQIEINECNENEYRCMNGQCIPKEFFQDDPFTPDCLDATDEFYGPDPYRTEFTTKQPSFNSEELTCENKLLTNSCVRQRRNMLLEIFYSSKTNLPSEQCFLASKCILKILDSENSFCREFCQHSKCVEIIKKQCPQMFYVPNVPIYYNDIYIAYKKDDLVAMPSQDDLTHYICFNNTHYDEIFIGWPNITFNNRTCFPVLILKPNNKGTTVSGITYIKRLEVLFELLKSITTITSYKSAVCDRPNIYHCLNSSKCISTHRLMDLNFDCPQTDDENITHIISTGLFKHLKNHFKCYRSNKYIPEAYVNDVSCTCTINNVQSCEDELPEQNFAREHISFQTICDNFNELSPIVIDEEEQTDETECQQWPCRNMYTRCDGVWNCWNGADEAGCYLSSTLNCSSDAFLCVSSATNDFHCLPLTKIHDDKINCLGGTDEPRLCENIPYLVLTKGFSCVRQTGWQCLDDIRLCDGRLDCVEGEDEQFCTTPRPNPESLGGICYSPSLRNATDVEKFLCHQMIKRKKVAVKYFSLGIMNEFIENKKKTVTNPNFSSFNAVKLSSEHQFQCHRGFNIRLWSSDEKNLTKNICLCPLSFYGNQCQYQNERVSLTIKFQTLSDSWSTLFAIIVSLIDDSEEKIIHSYQQFTYFPEKDCKIKFNIYLLYATRPKDQKKNYSIHIDIYEKASLTYRGSLLLPVKYSFLPVQRLVHIVDIPKKNEKIQSCSKSQCVHGKCITYFNQPEMNGIFCQCYRGWSGRYCTIPYTPACSPDSVSIGVSAYNRSICVCPIQKSGYNCLLIDEICQMNNSLACQNGGYCIPNDENMIFSRKFHCICPKGYSGVLCEIIDNTITFKIGKNVVLSQSIFIHFVEVSQNGPPKRTTTLRTIPLTQNSLKVYWSRPFNLVFIELQNKVYYLALIKKTYEPSTSISTIIQSSARCQNLSELFNETFTKMHLIRRIKYYHIPCQENPLNLSCFYDEVHFCLCHDFEQKRLVNCFEFDHNMKFDCFGRSVCENDGQCFQDTRDCPRRSTCICPSCFYGSRCQFMSSGFGLSLDAILGYHIQPYISMLHQPSIVKFSLALTMISVAIGLFNGILSFITFNNKVICETGCGLYLLGSSITTSLTMIAFGWKFWLLAFTQIATISNQSFLKIQCLFLDFILRTFLDTDQWLKACVAMERGVTVMQGTRFNKKKSKQTAKIVIGILLIIITSAYIYDPIYRRLIEEENDDEKRLWCIATYPYYLQKFNSAVQTFYFFAPFLINLISAIIIIVKKSHQQSNIHTNRSYGEILKQQTIQHKHILTAPIVLVILGIPRLIITYLSKCMKSTNDAWLFIIGYHISFIPHMLTFALYVLPSTFYTQQLQKCFVEFRTRMQRN
ncbi:unnamed protein product [Rotaria magnacalcarata]|uniref:Uncharacterized protein n=1 Tax=Rotaria magnacalcarata TaxID=392030 RepID=A0A816YR47_9BILA|nr:unnamed protein product [Rotaria magnacalcarata]CAF2167926.1 unnamed protein product [Rotaria magnacalcarata]CAF4112046.1 unnamed protein product [Rotaria magnacalcarata]CAF4176573.1 unnamed protein product [Rotaria magnacalcarata]